ncbi:hypothetical protein O1611_g7550 [Lasiodiplodia mahajangana]|uniref:Uncharacterized protein n=1 Tax=Lasiodiplodia mahajangana TaxID=1108764 RepID=A0ACC2JFS9_9PEZI|nr:hypothetical protein O1611_g7550 [Lasiodiplodia mahajangana]
MIYRPRFPRFPRAQHQNYTLDQRSLLRRETTVAKMAASSSDPIQVAFENAINSFKSDLGNDRVYHDMMTAIEPNKTRLTMEKEDLDRLTPFTDHIDDYLLYINAFCNKNPEIRRVIQAGVSQLETLKSGASFDVTLDAAVGLAERLPDFRNVATLLDQNPHQKAAIGLLFYRDILSFHLVTLKFLMLSSSDYNYDFLWPKYRHMIDIIFEHIPGHVSLIGTDVSLERIQQESEVLQSALRCFEVDERKRGAQEFYRIKMAVAPESQDERLDFLRRPVDPSNVDWLLQHKLFKNWTNWDSRLPPKILQLVDDPGTGKTHFTSHVINHLKSMGRTGFAFLSYKDESSTTALSVINALTFSLAYRSDELQTIIRESFSEECMASLRKATDFLIDFVDSTSPSFLVVDGLHEMEEVQRGRLASELLRIQNKTSKVRIFISCRKELGLSQILGRHGSVLYARRRNFEYIQDFVKKWAESWFEERRFWPEEQAEVESLLDSIVVKTRGVFSYVKIALNTMKFLYGLRHMHMELLKNQDEAESESENENESWSQSGDEDEVKKMSGTRTKRGLPDSFMRAAFQQSKRTKIDNVVQKDEQTQKENSKNMVIKKHIGPEVKVEVNGSPASLSYVRTEASNGGNNNGKPTSTRKPRKTASTPVTDLRDITLKPHTHSATCRPLPYPGLSESLDEAYDVILRMIDCSDHESREEARLVLGWIGCSPKALTVQEIQQLLTINLEAPGQGEAVREDLDLIEICGPMVEVVDGYAQFVHFTVKEYIFNDCNPYFIDLRAATLDLALRCIRYLCQDHHNLSLSNEQVSDNILSGVYTLDWFATTMWPPLVKSYLNLSKNDDAQSQLGLALDLLYNTRLQSEQEDTDDLALDSSTFQDTYPRAYSLICQALRFQERCTASEHHIYQGAPWERLDPLTTSKSSIRIYQETKRLLTSTMENGDSNGQLLRKLNGQRPYKCPYLGCPFNRTGFQDEAQSQSHIEHHDRPYKCTVPDCEISRQGFLSEKMLGDHFNLAHSVPQDHEFDAASVIPGVDDPPRLLLIVAQQGSVPQLSHLIRRIPNGEAGQRFDSEWKTKMCRFAITSGLPMFKLCISEFWAALQGGVETVIYDLVKWEQIEMLQHLLTSISDDGNDTLAHLHGIGHAISSQIYEAIDLWSDFIKARPWNQPHGPHGLYEVLKNQELIIKTANNRTKENLLIDIWRSIRWGKSVTEQTKARYYSKLLINVAQTTRSVALAEFLLKSGAMVDYQDYPGSGTALRYAVRGTGKEPRNLTKYLLDHGADNNIYGEDTSDEI